MTDLPIPNSVSNSTVMRSAEVRVPASTSNLGAGFDCFGLALQLYLSVRVSTVEDSREPCVIYVGKGKENETLPLTSENLIYRSMVYAAQRESLNLPPLRLDIENDIPVARGLGGSAAAIIAGIKLFSSLSEVPLSNEKILQYAVELEGHADNAAPSLLGGFVVNCIDQENQVISLPRPWPSELKVVVVVPELHLDTKAARAALADAVSHHDAVFNLQRAALFTAALAERRYDLLWEAMQDRLHQDRRAKMVPGLASALATPRMPGLHGIALSGAGPSVVALAQDHFEEIGAVIARSFEQQGVSARVFPLEIDTIGCRSLA
jgi:homoserine kinase